MAGPWGHRRPTSAWKIKSPIRKRNHPYCERWVTVVLMPKEIPWADTGATTRGLCGRRTFCTPSQTPICIQGGSRNWVHSTTAHKLHPRGNSPFDLTPVHPGCPTAIGQVADWMAGFCAQSTLYMGFSPPCPCGCNSGTYYLAGSLDALTLYWVFIYRLQLEEVCGTCVHHAAPRALAPAWGIFFVLLLLWC